MKNEYSTVIIIRNLTDKDRVMLKQLREAFSTKSNSKAVMLAAQAYEIRKAGVDEHQYIKLKSDFEAVSSDFLKLKRTVDGYFANIELNKSRESEFLEQDLKYSVVLKNLLVK